MRDAIYLFKFLSVTLNANFYEVQSTRQARCESTVEILQGTQKHTSVIPEIRKYLKRTASSANEQCRTGGPACAAPETGVRLTCSQPFQQKHTVTTFDSTHASVGA
jgi:hypothetical protein